MSFLAPLAFLFALSLPVVVVMYLLKRKRTVRLVPSTVLWQRFLNESQANAPFQRLRKNWLLLLQLLLLALLVFALARPFFSGQARQSRLRILVLDASASMQARDETPSRFEKARAEALGWVNGLRDGEQMMVLVAGAATEVKQSPTTDKAALRRAIESSVVTDAPTRLADALKTAGAFTFEKRGEEEVVTGEIHLFSDGAAPDLTELANKNLPITYHRVGSGSNNVGIVALDVKPNPEDPSRRAIFASVLNPTVTSRPVRLELLLDGELVDSRALTLAPTNTTPVVFVATQPQDGVFTVQMDVEDELGADNRAAVVSILPRPVRVLLVTKGNRFLEKALRAAGQVTLAVAADVTVARPEADVVVIDGVTPTVWPELNTLAIHTAPANWFDVTGRVEGPPVVDWRATHPLLRFVGLDNVQVAQATAVKLPSWAVGVVESPQTPLVLAGELGRQRIVWIGFDLLESTWPLRVSFPIFIANTVAWLDPSAIQAGLLTVRAGDPFRLPLAAPALSARVTLPGGTTRDLGVDGASKEIVFGDTAQQGIYRVVVGTNELSFAVNLLDPAETDIRSKEELDFGRFGSVAATSVKRANMELWRWIAAAGLLVLLGEWWFYHKRTA